MGKSSSVPAQSGSTNSTSTTTKTLPAWAQPTQQKILTQANYLTGGGNVGYPWVAQYDASGAPTGYKNIISNEFTQDYNSIPQYTSQIAPMNKYTSQGLDLTANRALAGSPITTSAQTELNKTLSGDYLTAESNPYISALYDVAADKITNAYNKSTVPQLQSAANRAGAFGGSSDTLLQGEAMKNLGTTLSDTATELYGTNYANERTNQMRGLALAPTIGNMDYSDYEKLISVGDAYNQYDQATLNDIVSQWKTAQNYPYSQLDKLTQYLSGAVGDTGTSVSNTTGESGSSYGGTSAAKNIAGGAASGAGLGLTASSLGLSGGLSAALGLIPFIGSLF